VQNNQPEHIREDPMNQESRHSGGPSPSEVKSVSLGLKVRVTTPDTDFSFEGIMQHFVAGESAILLDHHFIKGTQVRVEFNGFSFQGEIMFCEPKDKLYDTHIIIPDVDENGMRRDPRYVFNLAARLYPPGGELPIDATLVDISKEGLGLESPMSLEVGETVAVESQSNLAFGIVRHCRQLASGTYRAGLHVYNVIAKEVIAKEEIPARKQVGRRWAVQSLFSLGRADG
jgi:hypothetical protein